LLVARIGKTAFIASSPIYYVSSRYISVASCPLADLPPWLPVVTPLIYAPVTKLNSKLGDFLYN